MNEYRHRFRCSDEEYRALQMARNRVIDYKLMIRSFERDAEELMKLGLTEDALKHKEAANKLVKDLRYWEGEVKRLEAICFGRE